MYNYIQYFVIIKAGFDRLFKMSKLFEDSGSDDDHNISLETQNEYAKQYNTWREKEELYKRKLLLKSINFEPYFKITW